jgi:Domain of unknown function (DUF4430)
MRRRLALLLALAACALPAAGCGLGAGDERASEGSLTVTRDFGELPLRREQTKGATETETVMRLLERDFDVETRYGGNFVQEIDGVAGGREGGRRVDWFYYVNGIEAGVGAAERKVSPGDRIWWDHHDWTAAMRIPAVVGSFPEPFLSGSQGRRLPIRLVCLPGAGRACDEVETRLQDEGVKGTARSVLEQSAGKEVLRVLIGPWSEVRKDTAARKLESGPAASGVFARPTAAGDRIDLLDPRGRTVRVLGHGGGLVAATSVEAQQPTWLVTGVDGIGVAAAAAAMTEDELTDHFAIAIEEGRTVPLPVQEREQTQ